MLTKQGDLAMPRKEPQSLSQDRAFTPQEQMKQLVEQWVQGKINVTDGAEHKQRPVCKRIKLNDNFQIVKEGLESLGEIELIEESEPIKSWMRTWTNPTETLEKTEYRLNLREEALHKSEKMRSRTAGLNFNIGVAAFGAQFGGGGNVEWTYSQSNGETKTRGNEEFFTVPIHIFPGGVEYTFSCYRRFRLQKHSQRFRLEGQVVVQFKNQHRVIYENNQFIKTRERLAPTSANEVLLPLKSILLDLKDQQCLDNSECWDFGDQNEHVVCYTQQDDDIKSIVLNIKVDHKRLKPASTSSDTELSNTAAANSSTAQSVTFFTRKERVAVNMPDSLAKSKTFASTVKQKMLNGVTADADLALFLEQLADPNYPEKEFVKEMVRLKMKGSQNPDQKAYLAWDK